MPSSHDRREFVPQLPLHFESPTIPRLAPDESSEPAPPVILSVSDLQRQVRSELEARHTHIFVRGEISNCTLHRSGHAYFTLKDEGAQLRCVMWREQVTRLRFRLQDGQQVIVRGKLTVYEKGGQLQLSVVHVEPEGLGALELALRERIEKLRSEGLTSDQRKRPIPTFPRAIGVVTSRSGAALRDVLRTILRRDPFAHVVLSNTPVQGEGSAIQIARALALVDEIGVCDVIILARGGGSIEDLWAFNEEVVARAIVACRVPVVTGIGHETDTTIADLVADLRASTPTAASEHAVPIRSEVRRRYAELSNRMDRALLAHVQQLSRLLHRLEARLKDPSAAIQRRAQYLDDLSLRAERAMRVRLVRSRERLTRMEGRLSKRDPLSQIRLSDSRLRALEAQGQNAMGRRIERASERLRFVVGRLESMSPLQVLSRGYALTRRTDGSVVRSAAEVECGEVIRIRLHEGELSATVTGKTHGQDIA